MPTPQARRTSQRDVVESAVSLYERLHDRLLRIEASDEGLDAEFELGLARLQTLLSTATTLPLSETADQLLASYLSGPRAEDVEAHRAWIGMFPELMVDVIGSEKRHNAEFLLSWWVADRHLQVAPMTQAVTQFSWGVTSIGLVPWRERLRDSITVDFGISRHWPQRFTVFVEVKSFARNTLLTDERTSGERDLPAGNRQSSLALAA